MSNKQTCANCRFWRGQVESSLPPETPPRYAFGQCRRFPPPGVRAGLEEHPGEYSFGEFILTRRDEWCGEWQAANPETVDDAAAVMARAVLAGDASAARQLADKLIELIPLPVVADEAS